MEQIEVIYHKIIERSTGNGRIGIWNSAGGFIFGKKTESIGSGEAGKRRDENEISC